MPDEKTLAVNDKRREPYTRVIHTQPITFVCIECGQEVTIEQYPGAQPVYCFDCAGMVRRRKTAERVRRWRATREKDRP